MKEELVRDEGIADGEAQELKIWLGAAAVCPLILIVLAGMLLCIG